MEVNINPVAIDLGFIKIYWYGIMYLLAFTMAYLLGLARVKQSPDWNKDQISDLIFYGALGLIVGGRVGYIIFYDFSSFINNPLNIFKIWQGGMSFHGGAIGVLFAAYFFKRKYQKSFLSVIDFIVPLVPLGLAAGRFGNFINGELWGKASDLPWAMVFTKTDLQLLPRHPSMLYEMVLEGFVLFVILWVFSAKPKPAGSVFGMGLLFYGLFRFLVEFVRLPDAHLGYFAWNWLTMGQILSAPMFLLGLITIIMSYQYTNKK